MKKLFLFLLGFAALAVPVHADPTDWNYIPRSSYTEASNAGIVLFSSRSIQWVSVIISSPAPNSYLAIWRSSSPTMTPEISTSVLLATDYAGVNTGPTQVSLFEMKSASYTYIQKVGAAKIIMWFRCVGRKETDLGICPGIGDTGRY